MSNEIRQCAICGTQHIDMEPMPSTKGTFWICRERAACQQRAQLMEAQQKGVPVVRPAVERGPDPVDDVLTQGEFLPDFVDLARQYVGRRVQIVTMQPNPQLHLIQAHLKAVVEDCVVLATEFGSLMLRFEYIVSLAVVPDV